MIYLILIISIVFTMLLSFNQFFMVKLERGFKNDCTDSFVEKISNINEEIHVVYGKLYAYNPLNKKIIIEKKNVYSTCDYFKLNHEIAHSRDDSTRVIYFYMILIAIYRVLFIPSCIILCIAEFCGTTISKDVYHLLIVILISFILIKTYYILKYETKASKDALIELRKSITSEEASAIIKFSLCCIFQQLLITFIIGTSMYIYIDFFMTAFSSK